jgi:lipoprotein NlpD
MKEADMVVTGYRVLFQLGVAGLLLLVTACSTQSLSRAPVEDRNSLRPPAAVLDPKTQAVRQAPGFENAGKPGYYTVKPGETLIRIGLETGQNWKDLAAWNNLERPNQLEVGQVLRVLPPTAASLAAASASATTASAATTSPDGVVTRPIAASTGSSTVPVGPVLLPKPGGTTATTAGPVKGTEGNDEQLAWAWPVNGPVLAGFDEVKNKGLDLGGAAGEAVLAAADGRVVYVGAGLRGYGNLIILKHNSTYLTAYAHNQSLLVKEDQTVRRGQKIAEMGNSDADRVKLHFEVRRQGKPIDPAKFLPTR